MTETQTVTVTTTVPPTTTTPPPAATSWGMMGGYATGQLSDLAARGIRVEMVELQWQAAEPQEGVYDETYFQTIRNQVAAVRAVGGKVVLNFGLHHAPGWLLAKPGARFVAQNGAVYTASDEANLVFDTALRPSAEAYTAKVFAELGTDFAAVRVGGGHFGELQYPGQKDQAGKWEWFAFDQNAVAQAPSSYKPCTGPSSAAAAWLAWYEDALSGFQNWQIATVRRSYPGPVAVLYASWGMRSGDFDKAVAGNLCGASSAEVNGEVQRGFDHARHIGALTDPAAAIWGTWFDNAGTVSFLSGLAKAKGLQLMGENSGSDNLAAMQAAVGAAKQYAAALFMWVRASEAYCACNGYATVSDYQATVR